MALDTIKKNKIELCDKIKASSAPATYLDGRENILTLDPHVLVLGVFRGLLDHLVEERRRDTPKKRDRVAPDPRFATRGLYKTMEASGLESLDPKIFFGDEE